jgi:hypothetical protein
MYDLSWLNPTPHAIAVYASQPLSPAVTQHSLPSGRYSLLGPDFHRQDRTSFAAGAPILDTKVGTLSQAMYDMAKKQDLMIVSMKNDWERIFAFE